MMKKIMVLLAMGFGLLLFGCTPNTTTGTNATTGTTGTTATTETTERVFTLSQLSAYDGTGTAKAYIAVSGVVYDVTNADGWSHGWHQGLHLAGTDATAAFADSPHSASLLNSLPRVGILQN